MRAGVAVTAVSGPSHRIRICARAWATKNMATKKKTAAPKSAKTAAKVASKAAGTKTAVRKPAAAKARVKDAKAVKLAAVAMEESSHESGNGANLRGKALVIVESPAKAKTIGKYLGSGYSVKATVGHIRDLPTKTLGIDLDDGFE